jgi:hypothetical protein
MAKNPPYGDHHRVGAVLDRSQTYNPARSKCFLIYCLTPNMPQKTKIPRDQDNQ